MWYSRKLTKLHAYNVDLNVFPVLLKITGRRMLDCIHSSVEDVMWILGYSDFLMMMICICHM